MEFEMFMIALWMLIISAFVCGMFAHLFSYLRQIEKKIDQIHLEWRAKNGFAHPNMYPFDTKKF